MTRRNNIQYGEARVDRAFRWNQRVVHFQVDATSHCNAKCVSCARNHRGGDTIPYLKLNHLDLDLWKRVMSEDTKIMKIAKINFNGVWGDAIMHPQIKQVLVFLIIMYLTLVWETKILGQIAICLISLKTSNIHS